MDKDISKAFDEIPSESGQPYIYGIISKISLKRGGINLSYDIGAEREPWIDDESTGGEITWGTGCGGITIGDTTGCAIGCNKGCATGWTNELTNGWDTGLSEIGAEA